MFKYLVNALIIPHHLSETTLLLVAYSSNLLAVCALAFSGWNDNLSKVVEIKLPCFPVVKHAISFFQLLNSNLNSVCIRNCNNNWVQDLLISMVSEAWNVIFRP